MQSRLERLAGAVRTAGRITANLPYLLWYVMTHPGSWQGRRLFRTFYYSKAIIRFCEDMAATNMLLECPLDEGSVAFDVGGYKGEWAKQIKRRYNPCIHIFEPDEASFRELQGVFGSDPRVTCHRFGLAGSERTATLRHSHMGSTIFDSSPAKGKKTSEIRLRDIRTVVEELGVAEVDLIKINIEGGEYELLDRLIEAGLLPRFKRVRVQFHEWIPGSHRMYRRIREGLARTHEIEWHYSFVWESWVRRDLTAHEAQAPGPGAYQAG